VYRKTNAPTCPYCGDIAGYGDSRLAWLSYHLDYRPHRWWWRLKKLFRRA
jgi:hypothetical protein